MAQRVLYIIACGAPPSRDITKFVQAAQDDDWDACLIASPSAIKFLDAAYLVSQTRHPVRSDYKKPADPDSLPDPDAIIVAPTTVNTINKWAAGICDTLALGILVEAIGQKLPVVSLPFTNWAQAAHPAFEQNIAKLRSWGVQVLYGPDVYALHAPGTGEQHLDAFPWHLALQAVADVRPRTRGSGGRP